MIVRVSLATLILSYFFGLAFYLLLEKPLRNIDKLVLFPTKISDSILIKKQARSKGIGGKKRSVVFTEGPNLENGRLESDSKILSKCKASINTKEKYKDDEKSDSDNASDESEDEHTTTVCNAKTTINNLMRNSIYLKDDQMMEN